MGNANSGRESINPSTPRGSIKGVKFADNVIDTKIDQEHTPTHHHASLPYLLHAHSHSQKASESSMNSPRGGSEHHSMMTPLGKKKQRPSLSADVSFAMGPSQIVRGRSGIHTKAPVNGQVLFMLLHITNIPAMDLASESDVYCTAQVFNSTGGPISELLFWPVRNNAKNPVWNTVRSSRQLTSVSAGDVIKFQVYDWDTVTADDLIATGSYVIPKDFEDRPSDSPVSIKCELSPGGQAAAALAATPAVIRSAASDSRSWMEAALSFPSRAFKFVNHNPEPKKNAIKIPTVELSFVITKQREYSRLASKRVFFLVNAETIADEAEKSAKFDPMLLKNLFRGIPSDHGLSIEGIRQAHALKTRLGEERKRLGKMRMHQRKLHSEKSQDKIDKYIEREFTSEDKMIADLLRASVILASPQSRSIGTAMIALQEHLAAGSGRRAMIALENKSKEEQADIDRLNKLMADPKAPPVEGDGIVVATHLRDIFVNRAWLDFSEKRGRDIGKRAIKLLKEANYDKVNETVPNIDWVEALSRYEEIVVHPNDCWHEWWDPSPEKPRALQQRSCETLQMLRTMRDEVAICAVGGKFLRYLLRDACESSDIVEGLRPANANFSRCCVVCADFDFTKDLHRSLIDLTFMFDGEIVMRQLNTKLRIKERQVMNAKALQLEMDGPPTPEKGQAEPPAEKRKKRRPSAIAFAEPPPPEDEEQLKLEEFMELIGEEPDTIIAVAMFFLEHMDDPLYQPPSTRLFQRDSDGPLSEKQLEDQLGDKVSQKESRMKLVMGLKSMGIVLSQQDVEAVFGTFSKRFRRSSSGAAIVQEDPIELLLTVVQEIIDDRSRHA